MLPKVKLAIKVNPVITFLKISLKSVSSFLRYFANRPTKLITDLAQLVSAQNLCCESISATTTVNFISVKVNCIKYKKKLYTVRGSKTYANQ